MTAPDPAAPFGRTCTGRARTRPLGTDICPRCHGTGTEHRGYYVPGELKLQESTCRCTRCGGSGEIPKRPQVGAQDGR